MSLSSSLSAALSGITANARAAEVVSSNVANARTPGYGVRSVALTSQQMGVSGAGVQVVAIERQENLRLISDRRNADASQGNATELASFHRRIEQAIGLPEDPGSLGAAIARMEGGFVEASSRPESSARLATAAAAARDVATKLNTISDQIIQTRQDAEQSIARTVSALNTDLQQVEDLNRQIRRMSGSGRETAALMDQRQQIVDRVAAEIPLQQVDRGRGEIALISHGGVLLLDGRAGTFGFEPRTTITPEMTVASGGLSQLSFNGKPLDALANHGPIRGGRLEGLFEVRDRAAVTAQARVDAVARDLMERFEDPAVDPTRAPGTAGLFADNGRPFDASKEVGLATRLELNPSLDPSRGGDLWKMRAGTGATTEGQVGDATQILRFVDAMAAARTQTSGDFVTAARSASGLASDLLSVVSAQRTQAEVTETFASTQALTLREAELKTGVDTDFEMQQLLLIEQAYAANARIVEVVGEMLDRLSRI